MLNMKDNQPLRLFLVNPDNTLICELNGIDESSCNLTLNLNNQFELEFDYLRYFTINDTQVESNGYNSLLVGMKIYVENVGYFKMKYPPYSFDGEKELKHISANSVESELEDKDLVNFYINTGEQASAEYLVEYDEDEDEELLNPATGLPYDYIVLYNTYPKQLIQFKCRFSDGVITDPNDINEIVQFCKLIPRLQRKYIKDEQGQFSNSIEYVQYNYNGTDTIQSITLHNIESRVDELVRFYDKYRKQLSLLDLVVDSTKTLWTIGNVDRSLLNRKCSFNIDTQNIYSFLTQEFAQAARCIVQFDCINYKINCIDIENIGEDSGVIIDKNNLLNQEGIEITNENIVTRFSVTGGDNLNIYDVNFGSSRIVNIDYYLNAKDESGNRIYMTDELANKYEAYKSNIELAREEYIESVRLIRNKQRLIDEIKYRLPNDEIKNDWGTFSIEELNAASTHFNNLLLTLIDLYKADYPNGIDNSGAVIESTIKDTEYWHDYYAYRQALVQIEVAQAIGSSYKDTDIQEYRDMIDAYKTEWTLYGTVELGAIIQKYDEQLKILIDNGSVIVDDSGSSIDWGNLTTAQQQGFAGKDIYSIAQSEYDRLLGEQTGCKEYLSQLTQSVNALQNEYDTLNHKAKLISEYVTFEKYNHRGLSELVSGISAQNITFTDNEIITITNLYTDGEYSNDNFQATSIDNIETIIDIEKELLDEALEQLSIESQPQFTFSASIDNLLCMPEFADYNFDIGNYILLQYSDDYYVKLRLNSISYNPLVPESSLDVTFTNYVTSKSKRNDLSQLLNGGSSGSSSSSSSGSSGGSGSFGAGKGIDEVLSNTMLAKLLNTELFNTRVTNAILDTLRLNTLNAKYATFGSLAQGQTVIDGACLTTGVIKSRDFNGTYDEKNNRFNLDSTAGSMIDLYNGRTSFGGGKLIYDGSTLSVNGVITTNNATITGGTLRVGNNFSVSNTGVLSASGASISGTLTAGKDSSIGGWKITDGKIYFDGTPTAVMQHPSSSVTYVFAAGGNSNSNYSDCPFRVTKNGALYATNATITGGSFNINNNFIVNTNGTMSFAGNLRMKPSGYDKYIDIIAKSTDNENYPIKIGANEWVWFNNQTYFVRSISKEAFFGTTGEAGGMRAFREDSEVILGAGRRYVFRPETNTDGYLGTGSYKWHSVYCSDGAFNGSDRKIKNHIEYLSEIANIDDFIMGLKPVSYTLKSGEGKRRHLGLYAQDVAKSANDTIGDIAAYQATKIAKDKSGKIIEEYFDETASDDELSWVLNYNELIAPIIAVIQNQQRRIDALETEIKQLK